VPDFTTSGISDAEMRLFTDYIASHIVEAGGWRVIDRNQRASILTEQEFSTSDCTDESCQLQVGKLLAASRIVVGSVGMFQGAVILNAKLIDVESGVALKTASNRYGSMRAMLDDSRRLTRGARGEAASPKAKVHLPASKSGMDRRRSLPPGDGWRRRTGVSWLANACRGQHAVRRLFR
jgi:TolB-like protein